MPWTLSECSPHAQAVIASARAVAERIGNNYVGPEHLFLAILDLPHCGAAEVLARLGLSLESLRDQLRKQTGQGKVPTDLGEYKLTPRVRRVMEFAEECVNNRFFSLHQD
jgi:ATP-dependent Clp protease ATP-binding subunit ClpC